MKQRTFFISLFMTVGLLTSCHHDIIRASGEVTSLEYSIPEYSEVKVANAFTTYVTFSEGEEGIRIEANENLHNKISVQREGNTLVIKLKKFTNVRGNATLNAYITTKDVTSFDISGASRISLENEWNVENARIELSGASDFTGNINATRLNLDMTGASKSDLFGSVTSLDADLSGSSEIRDYDLTIDTLTMELSGASEAFLSISERIDIKASGASVLHYKGPATIQNQTLSGASEVRNRN